MKFRALRSFKQRFIFFGRNSGVHGLNHLFSENAIFLARLFWLVVIVVSLGCLYLLLVPVLELGTDINFTPDTRYLNWTTKFPAITICEKTGDTQAQKRLSALYPDLVKPISYDHGRYLAKLMYGVGTCSNKQCQPCGLFVPCDVPWREIMLNVHKKCDEILAECTYNGVSFPCCNHFLPVDSEYGPCFAFNSLQNPNGEPLIVMNRTTGPGGVSLRVLTKSELSIHSNEELSTNALSNHFKFTVDNTLYKYMEVLFTFVEIENDPSLTSEKIENRNCRFINEIPDEPFYKYEAYSYGACKLASDTEHAFEHCGCVSPIRYIKYEHLFCNYTGMNCLAKHEAERAKGLLDENYEDEEECLPSCDETEFSVIHVSRRATPKVEGEGILVDVKMLSLPTLRYRRNLVRTNLDLVVSIGGMVGLFFSASVLSGVEIFYLFLRSPTR